MNRNRVLAAFGLVLLIGGIYGVYRWGGVGQPLIECDVAGLEKGMILISALHLDERPQRTRRLVVTQCDIEPAFKAVLLSGDVPEKHLAQMAAYIHESGSRWRRRGACGDRFEGAADMTFNPISDAAGLSWTERNELYFDACGLSRLGYAERAEAVSKDSSGGRGMLYLYVDLERSNVPSPLRRRLYRAMEHLP